MQASLVYSPATAAATACSPALRAAILAAMAEPKEYCMKSRFNVLELSLHNLKMKTLKPGRKVKLKVKCKAYMTLVFALWVNAAC